QTLGWHAGGRSTLRSRSWGSDNNGRETDDTPAATDLGRWTWRRADCSDGAVGWGDRRGGSPGRRGSAAAAARGEQTVRRGRTHPRPCGQGVAQGPDDRAEAIRDDPGL